MILTLLEAAELKKEIADNFSVQLHFHDGCGGQYFSFDKTDVALARHITDFLAMKNLHAVFSDDGLQFTVENFTRGK